MITLITGQPGSGKTLLTLDELRKETQRPIYYSGIPDLRLPWIELDKPEEWPACPPGSIIVIDEAQRAFRPRGAGSVVPRHVSALETHRHAGHDLYIITQHPMLIDGNVRRLVGEHRHIVRAFGSKIANVHKWQEVNANPDKIRKDSIVTTRHYPRDVFALYKSAEQHTHKLRIPPRLAMLVLAPFVLGALGYGIYKWQQGMIDPGRIMGEAKPDTAQPPGRTESPQEARPDGGGYRDLNAFIPRVPGVPESAPRYDEITTPKRAPQIAGCVSGATACRCYMPDGSRYPTTEDICRHVASNGAPFLDWVEPVKPSEPGGERAAPTPGSMAATPQPALTQAPSTPGRQAGDIVGMRNPPSVDEIVIASVEPSMQNPSGMSWPTWWALRGMQRSD